MNYKIERPKPSNKISFKHEDGEIETIDISENGKVLYNGESIDTLESHEKVLAMLIKGLCGFVR